MADADSEGLEGRGQLSDEHSDQRSSWAGGKSMWWPCTDGKLRRVPANETGEPEPSLFPLAYGIPNRMGTLRGAGNAIVPEVAAEFIKAAENERNMS
jgi:DNA (cytosine-5)-methyltransferase 1